MTKARILADYVAGGTTAAEFDYMDGVTSNVQTQLDAKAPLASPTFTGNFTSVGIDDNASGATAITIDANENVGIGFPNAEDYTSLTGLFDITSQGNPRASIIAFSDTGSERGRIRFTKSHTDTVGDFISTVASEELGSIEWYGINGSNLSTTAGSIRMVQDGETDNRTPCKLVFATGLNTAAAGTNVDRMVIDKSGNVIVGNSGTWASGSDVFLMQASGEIDISRDSASLVTMIGFYNDNGGVGTIKTTGSSTQYNTSSDYRLKENVTSMSGSVDRLKNLKPSQFNFIADSKVTMDGFLAHEVSAIVPEAVSGEKDAMKTVSDQVATYYTEEDDLPEGKKVGNVKTAETTKEVIDPQGIDHSKLVPLLVSALQEAITRIEALESA